MKKDPNGYQIGGDHYRRTKTQHWDFVRAMDLDFFLGTATKYLARHKDPDADARKCLHYLSKAASLNIHPPNLLPENRWFMLAEYAAQLPKPYGTCVKTICTLSPAKALPIVRELLKKNGDIVE